MKIQIGSWTLTIKRKKPSDGEVLVHGSWFPKSELPHILENFMRGNEEYGRRWKEAEMKLQEIRDAAEKMDQA
jgi:hypothetical protein